MVHSRPAAMVRRLLRAPNMLYDRDLGWLLGERFLRLVHVGRTSGRRYRTVLEVVGAGPRSGEVVVLSGLLDEQAAGLDEAVPAQMERSRHE